MNHLQGRSQNFIILPNNPLFSNLPIYTLVNVGDFVLSNEIQVGGYDEVYIYQNVTAFGGANNMVAFIPIYGGRIQIPQVNFDNTYYAPGLAFPLEGVFPTSVPGTIEGSLPVRNYLCGPDNFADFTAGKLLYTGTPVGGPNSSGDSIATVPTFGVDRMKIIFYKKSGTVNINLIALARVVKR